MRTECTFKLNCYAERRSGVAFYNACTVYTLVPIRYDSNFMCRREQRSCTMKLRHQIQSAILWNLKSENYPMDANSDLCVTTNAIVLPLIYVHLIRCSARVKITSLKWHHIQFISLEKWIFLSYAMSYHTCLFNAIRPSNMLHEAWRYSRHSSLQTSDVNVLNLKFEKHKQKKRTERKEKRNHSIFRCHYVVLKEPFLESVIRRVQVENDISVCETMMPSLCRLIRWILLPHQNMNRKYQRIVAPHFIIIMKIMKKTEENMLNFNKLIYILHNTFAFTLSQRLPIVQRISKHFNAILASLCFGYIQGGVLQWRIIFGRCTACD